MRFFQAEDGIRDVERSRGLGDVYKRQGLICDDEDNKTRFFFIIAVQKNEIFDYRNSAKVMLSYNINSCDQFSPLGIRSQRISNSHPRVKQRIAPLSLDHTHV